MRVLGALSSALLLAAISPAAGQTATNTSSARLSNSTSPCSCTVNDTSVVEFAWALQNLTNQFYSKVGLNTTLLMSAPNNSAAEWIPNYRGIAKQSQLGLLAVRREAAKCPMFTPPTCNYSIPMPRDPTSLLLLSQKLEASVCGAMIGLAGYTHSPEVSFLIARLAAGHAAHAAFIESHLTAPMFKNASNMTLIEAYPPRFVLARGNRTGMLGQWLGGCVKAPAKPCGETLIVGPISGNLTSNLTVISSVLATETTLATEVLRTGTAAQATGTATKSG